MMMPIFRDATGLVRLLEEQLQGNLQDARPLWDIHLSGQNVSLDDDFRKSAANGTRTDPSLAIVRNCFGKQAGGSPLPTTA